MLHITQQGDGDSHVEGFMVYRSQDPFEILHLEEDANDASAWPSSQAARIRVYDFVSVDGHRHGAAPVTVSVALSPPQGLEDELNDWYKTEHVPLLSKVPGWRSTRRYKLRKGEGPLYLALHEYEEENGMGTSLEFKKAVETPWTQKLISASKANGTHGYERRVWKHLQL